MNRLKCHLSIYFVGFRVSLVNELNTKEITKIIQKKIKSLLHLSVDEYKRSAITYMEGDTVKETKQLGGKIWVVGNLTIHILLHRCCNLRLDVPVISHGNTVNSKIQKERLKNELIQIIHHLLLQTLSLETSSTHLY